MSGLRRKGVHARADCLRVAVFDAVQNVEKRKGHSIKTHTIPCRRVWGKVREHQVDERVTKPCREARKIVSWVAGAAAGEIDDA